MAVCSVTFQHEMTPARAQERPQRLSRNDQVRRGVYVQPGRLGQILGSCEGRLERGSLELDSEANRGGLGEQGLRVGTVGEARQGFIADDRIARQIDYRLEDRVEGSRVDDARDALATPAHQGPFRDVAADQSPGEVGELDQRRQHFRDGHFLHGSLGVDHEQPDELLVRSNGRISNRVDAEAAQEISVGIPWPFHPGLDPGSVMGSLVQPLTVVGKVGTVASGAGISLSMRPGAPRSEPAADRDRCLSTRAPECASWPPGRWAWGYVRTRLLRTIAVDCLFLGIRVPVVGISSARLINGAAGAGSRRVWARLLTRREDEDPRMPPAPW